MTTAIKPSSRPVVAVLGATGHTGRFVVAELQRRRILPIAIGRDPATLTAAFPGDAIARRHATLDDAASLDRALEGALAVINCAGPFLDTAAPVVSAALRARIHYLDVTAEQASAQATFDGFDAAARDTGVAVIPAMGFYGGFADLLVTAALGDWDRADTIDIMIGLDSWHPTQGTRATGARNTAPRVVVSGGKIAPLATPSPAKEWEFGAPLGRQTVVEVPFSEINVIARHLKIGELHTFLSRIALDDIRDSATPPPKPADASGFSPQRFVVDVVITRDGKSRRAIGRGRDIYGFSAPLICEAAERLIKGEFREPGAQAPGAIFDAKDVLEALAPEYLSFGIEMA